MVNRGEEKVRVHMNVVPRSTKNTNGETEVFFSTVSFCHAKLTRKQMKRSVSI